MRIGVAVGWPFRYTTCWVELGSSESESDWTFFFLIALASEGVENTDDSTPDRKLELFSSKKLGSYPLRRLARRSAAAFSSGDVVLILRSINEFPWIFTEKWRSDSSSLDSLLRGVNQLVNWEVLTSTDTEVRVILIKGLSPVLLRGNVWLLVEGARGLLLLCDGMILTKSNTSVKLGNTSVKCEANPPWKRR